MKDIRKVVEEHRVNQINKLLEKDHLFYAMMLVDGAWIDKFVILKSIFGMSLIECVEFKKHWQERKDEETFLQIYYKVRR